MTWTRGLRRERGCARRESRRARYEARSKSESPRLRGIRLGRRVKGVAAESERMCARCEARPRGASARLGGAPRGMRPRLRGARLDSGMAQLARLGGCRGSTAGIAHLGFKQKIDSRNVFRVF